MISFTFQSFGDFYYDEFTESITGEITVDLVPLEIQIYEMNDDLVFTFFELDEDTVRIAKDYIFENRIVKDVMNWTDVNQKSVSFFDNKIQVIVDLSLI